MYTLMSIEIYKRYIHTVSIYIYIPLLATTTTTTVSAHGVASALTHKKGEERRENIPSDNCSIRKVNSTKKKLINNHEVPKNVG